MYCKPTKSRTCDTRQHGRSNIRKWPSRTRRKKHASRNTTTSTTHRHGCLLLHEAAHITVQHSLRYRDPDQPPQIAAHGPCTTLVRMDRFPTACTSRAASRQAPICARYLRRIVHPTPYLPHSSSSSFSMPTALQASVRPLSSQVHITASTSY